MNRSFDYNGVQIAPSRPVQKLRTVKKIIHIDSADRDRKLFPNNGDFVVYLPKTYEKVVSINLKSALFPPTFQAAPGNEGVAIWTASGFQSVMEDPSYFFIELEGLNKSDETSMSADRSALTNSVFAKIPVPNATDRVQYSENRDFRQAFYYQPAISKLDRIHITTRLHDTTYPYGTPRGQYIYWPSGPTSPPRPQEFSLTLEIETLENSFDDYSSIETRIGERSDSGFFVS